MKILSAEQIRQLDAYTIEHEPIASIDLMERASRSFAQWFVRACPPQEERPVLVFCGTGNNGGDGLAIARLLAERFYQVEVFHCKISERGSADFQANLSRLVKKRTVPIHTLTAGQSLPAIPPRSILIDALFGSGLNRPVEGYWAELIEHLNRAQASRVAVDIPSGLFADRASSGTVFRADHTLTFELPKLAFLMAENAAAVGRLHVRSIGLHTGFIRQAETEHFLLEEADLRPLLKERGKFDHKGTFGHALLLCGSYGKVGAAILSGKACLRSGAGLLTIHAPRCAYEILQIGFPEAMVSVDPHQYVFTQAGNLQPYRAIGLGPGWGTNRLTAEGLHDLLERVDLPLVIDADALNLLAENPDWLKKLPAQSILCPHPGEFSRLFGPSANQFERLQLQKDKARELNCVLILKGAYSSIALPDGKVYFNSTGNPGMGTAGSGDVLTGLLTGLLAQGYSSCDAALLGVYLHGLAGDLACRDLDQEALLAGDLIRYFGKAFHALRKKGIDMKKLIVLTGAGISAESGIKTFRDAGGLWEGHDVMEVASPEGWHRNHELVLDFYNQRRRQLQEVEPNAAHHALVELEEHYEVVVVTQNVDDLHERAGSSRIVHLHGELIKVRSTYDPSLVYEWRKDLLTGDLCEKGHQLRPHIVWFGEMVPMLQIAADHTSEADIVLIVGTSMQVYPAAGLVGFAPPHARVYYVDPNPSINYELGRSGHLTVVSERATTGVRKVVDQLLRSG